MYTIMNQTNARGAFVLLRAFCAHVRLCFLFFQEDALCGYLTARESLVLAAELRGLLPPHEVAITAPADAVHCVLYTA